MEIIVDGIDETVFNVVRTFNIQISSNLIRLTNDFSKITRIFKPGVYNKITGEPIIIFGYPIILKPSDYRSSTITETVCYSVEDVLNLINSKATFYTHGTDIISDDEGRKKILLVMTDKHVDYSLIYDMAHFMVSDIMYNENTEYQYLDQDMLGMSNHIQLVSNDAKTDNDFIAYLINKYMVHYPTLMNIVDSIRYEYEALKSRIDSIVGLPITNSIKINVVNRRMFEVILYDTPSARRYLINTKIMEINNQIKKESE